MRARPAVAAAALVVLATPLLGACTATDITAGRVDGAVGPAFSRLYTLQQQRLGRDTTRTAARTATCTRNRAGTSPAERDRGAGDDWLCVLDFPYPDGHVEPVNYDVRVQPTGCYTAQGPSQVVGRQHQRTPAGALVTNPLFEFDGCLTSS